MKEQCVRIRSAEINDAEALLAIYTPYIKETAITFEYEVPALVEFTQRIWKTLQRYPYLVAECDGQMVGYAYAGAFKERAAYDWSVETSIYVAKEARRRGVGEVLLLALEAELKRRGFLNVNACIAYAEAEDEYLTPASVCFHQKLGYQMVGRFHQCGYKFGRWYDMVWMEKMLGEHIAQPACPFGMPEIGASDDRATTTIV